MAQKETDGTLGQTIMSGCIGHRSVSLFFTSSFENRSQMVRFRAKCFDLHNRIAILIIRPGDFVDDFFLIV